MNGEIAELRQELASLRRETNQRHEYNVINADKRQREILDRLDRQNGSIGKAHDRSAALEAVTNYLRAELTMIRDRYHAILNGQQVLPRPPREAGTVQWGDLKTMVTIIISCIGGTALMLIWILHVTGVIK